MMNETDKICTCVIDGQLQVCFKTSRNFKCRREELRRKIQLERIERTKEDKGFRIL